MSESTTPLSGTGPSDVLLKYPELHRANLSAPVPAAFKPAPWWSCLFGGKWTEPEFVQMAPFKYRRPGLTDWTSAVGSIYRQTNRRTGARRYTIAGASTVMSIDAGAWEHGQVLVFT